jgi:hypothetical protein
VTDSIRVGIRAGLVLSVLGIVFALPTLSATIRVATLVNGGGGWLVLTANLIPLERLSILSTSSRRINGLWPRWLGMHTWPMAIPSRQPPVKRSRRPLSTLRRLR